LGGASDSQLAGARLAGIRRLEGKGDGGGFLGGHLFGGFHSEGRVVHTAQGKAVEGNSILSMLLGTWGVFAGPV